MSKMWSGRFSVASAKLLDEFNASLPFDKTLYEADIKGSIAHETMLANQGILTHDEAKHISDCLFTVQSQRVMRKFRF